MTQPNDLRLQAVMPAPPEAVYAALTDAAALRVWLAEHAEVAMPDRYEFWGRYTPDGAEPHQRLRDPVDDCPPTVQEEFDRVLPCVAAWSGQPHHHGLV